MTHGGGERHHRMAMRTSFAHVEIPDVVDVMGSMEHPTNSATYRFVIHSAVIDQHRLDEWLDLFTTTALLDALEWGRPIKADDLADVRGQAAADIRIERLKGKGRIRRSPRAGVITSCRRRRSTSEMKPTTNS